MSAFTSNLSPEALAHFNNVSEMPFSKQAVQFLDAFWEEVGSQAEFIFSVSIEMMKYADMHTKGVSLIHLYDEGNQVDLNVGLYFYEKLCKRVLDEDAGKQWRTNPHYAISMPTMLTAITRKQELREKVDVNFDGRISFLEYLLYQYRDFCNPLLFCERSMREADEGEHPEITKARAALEEVNAAIRAYLQEKTRLEQESKQPGVRGLTAKHTLAQLAAGPLAERLNHALINAEAAVRKVTKQFGAGAPQPAGDGEAVKRPGQGSMFWLGRDLDEKKKLYGRRASTFQRG